MRREWESESVASGLAAASRREDWRSGASKQNRTEPVCERAAQRCRRGKAVAERSLRRKAAGLRGGSVEVSTPALLISEKAIEAVFALGGKRAR